VTSAITGAVVSVVEELSVVSGKISSLLEHEETSTAMLTIRINQDNKLFKLFFFRKYSRSKTEKGYDVETETKN